jgi:hypothetical protein
VFSSENKLNFFWKSDVIQAPKDLLEVPVGPVTRLRAKRFKETFNGLILFMFKRGLLVKPRPLHND